MRCGCWLRQRASPVWKRVRAQDSSVNLPCIVSSTSRKPSARKMFLHWVEMCGDCLCYRQASVFEAQTFFSCTFHYVCTPKLWSQNQGLMTRKVNENLNLYLWLCNLTHLIFPSHKFGMFFLKECNFWITQSCLSNLRLILGTLHFSKAIFCSELNKDTCNLPKQTRESESAIKIHL